MTTEHRNFNAEIISISSNVLFLNIDLGFRVWKIVELNHNLSEAQMSNLGPGSFIRVEISMVKSQKNRTYTVTNVWWKNCG